MWLGKYTEALAAFNNPELTNNYHLLPRFIDVGEYDHQNNDESLEIQFMRGGFPELTEAGNRAVEKLPDR
jgi:hypothetical protein